MRTVSKEMAIKLKEAGLQWEPRRGDQCLLYMPCEKRYFKKPIVLTENGGCFAPEDVWLPTLSDLLQWLDRQGYVVDITRSFDFEDKPPYFICEVWERKKGSLSEYWDQVCECKANNREEAVAKAVLWVLEQTEKDENRDC